MEKSDFYRVRSFGAEDNESVGLRELRLCALKDRIVAVFG
jgi:hypothetical protein